MAEKPDRRRGRPEALGVTAREVVVALLTAGVSRAAAARYVGVCPQTLKNTADRDLAFASRLDRAEASHLLQHARVIGVASEASWRPSAWALERLLPDRFGDPDRRTLRRSRARRRRRLLALWPGHIRRVLDEELSGHAPAKNRIVKRLMDWCEALLNTDGAVGYDDGGGAE